MLAGARAGCLTALCEGLARYTTGCQQRSIGSLRIADAVAPSRSASVTRSVLPSSRPTKRVLFGTVTCSS